MILQIYQKHIAEEEEKAAAAPRPKTMLVNYEYYRVFYHVARYGSFTAAARALHTGQPNITRTIGPVSYTHQLCECSAKEGIARTGGVDGLHPEGRDRAAAGNILIIATLFAL